MGSRRRIWEFKALMATRKLHLPAFVFFIVYLLSLPILVGYAPEFMSTKVIGNVNIAYLFALSQFFMAWTIAWLYVRLPPTSTGSRRTSSRKPKATSRANRRSGNVDTTRDVPDLHRHHTRHHVLGRSERSSGSSAYFAAGRRITGWQNGIAVAGDYMSAATFLGIAGIIAFRDTTASCISVGWLVAYLTVLLIVAEPLRNAGKYTMADVLAYRLQSAARARHGVALSTLTVSTFYMIAQMVGAGTLVALLSRTRHQLSTSRSPASAC